MGPKPDPGEGAAAGAADPRDSVKNRALLSLLKDGMKPLDTNALDMRNQLVIFRAAIERYFKAIGVDDLNDHDDDNEQTRLQIVRSVMGPEAATALIGIADTEIDTYNEMMDTLTDRFAPSDDDVHSLGLVIQCRMRDDESTKQYVNRVRALVSRMGTMASDWQTKHILAVLRFTHKSAKLRDLLAEKNPATVQEAEKIAEAFETRAKDKPSVDRLVGALAGPSSSLPVDNVRMRGGAASGNRGQCHNCGGQGHFAKVCPSARRDNGRGGGSGAQRGQQRGHPATPPQRSCGRNMYRGAQQFRTSYVPAHNVGYSGYVDTPEYDPEAWQAAQHDSVEAPYDGPGPSDYSGAMAASFAPTDSVGYGYGSPHRAPPQYLPSEQRRRDLQADLNELCLLEADMQMHMEHVSTFKRPFLQKFPGGSHEWWTTVRTSRGALPFKVDTGAKGNVCSLRDLHRLGYTQRDLRPSNVVLISFTKALVRPIGTLVTSANVNGRDIPFVLHVVSVCNSPLLSFPTAVQARLVQPPADVLRTPGAADSDLDKSHPTPVHEFSAYQNEIIHLQVRENAVPKQFPPRRVPLALQDQAHFELMEMVRDGIIEPVTEATEWCHPMLVTPKPNGRLRVCMDPRYLNDFLVRAVHPFPDIEQVFSSVRGARYFSKIDLTHGFWNLRLDEASSRLCVFASPWGRFRYKRLPFGVSPAPEVFHRVVADVIRDLPHVIHYIDDILIFAASQAEHDALVREILQRLRRVGFAICNNKCSFSKREVTFLGHLISGDAIRPDPLKMEALQCMQPPSTLAELQSFLGFVNYIARYVPNLATLAEPLRRLQSSKVHFAWTDEQDRSFRAIRQCLLDSPGLAPFDPSLPLVVATDASQHGIGGVLLQNDRPVLYVARALTPAETRYAIIEKELLAVVFVLTRCHFYTFGCPVTVKTDHKPLLGLVSSDADKLSLRLRRFVERLFPYALSWSYVPGKDNHFPDALSRLSFHAKLTVDEHQTVVHLARADQALHAQLLAGGPLFRDIHAAAASDLQFQALLKCAAHGWPPKLVKRDARRHLLQPYWAIRDELRLVGSFLLWGERVCVPRALQSRALALLHQGHPGINFMHQRAKNIFYWPGITADTSRYVANCDDCVRCQALPPREPLLQEPPAAYPGERIAADFFDLGSETYLVACDSFSNFPFYAKVASPTSAALIAAARVIFLQSGFPRVFQSDGGPAFRSDAFQAFLRQGACHHRISSPRYAQSNGAAERVVQTIKTLRRKANSADELFLAVLQLQNTPRPDSGVSPSQLFFGRTQRTPLHPIVRQHSSPWPVQQRVLHARQASQAAQYNCHTRTRAAFSWYPGQQALLRDPDVPPQVVEIMGPAPQPRAFLVRFASGVISSRNQRFLFSLHSGSPPTTSSQACPVPPRQLRSAHHHRDSTGVLSKSASTSAALSSLTLVRPTCVSTRPASTHHHAVTPPSPSRGLVPHPTPLTTSTSSSGPVSSPLSAFPPGVPSPTALDSSPVRRPAGVTDRGNALGTSRGGRIVWPSLRARESAATGQSRPQQILRPPTTAPTSPRSTTTTPTPPPPPAATGTLLPTTPATQPPPSTAPPPTIQATGTCLPGHGSSCATDSVSVLVASPTTATTLMSWTSSGRPKTRPPSSPSTTETRRPQPMTVTPAPPTTTTTTRTPLTRPKPAPLS